MPPGGGRGLRGGLQSPPYTHPIPQVRIWEIPEGGLKRNMTEAVLELYGHSRRVGLVEWHPTTNNILFSAGYDYKVSPRPRRMPWHQWGAPVSSRSWTPVSKIPPWWWPSARVRGAWCPLAGAGGVWHKQQPQKGERGALEGLSERFQLRNRSWGGQNAASPPSLCRSSSGTWTSGSPSR